jgi:hypothetical protein
VAPIADDEITPKYASGLIVTEWIVIGARGVLDVKSSPS